MQLPKISHPIFTINVPPTNKAVSFRPMLVKEEKLLLMAKENREPSSILAAIKQVVNNCCLDPAFEVNLLPLFVLEYVFIKLRGASVGDKVEISFTDSGDQNTYKFSVDLNQVTIKYPDPKPEDKIEITPTSGLVMQWPTATIYDDADFLSSDETDMTYKFIVKCIGQIYDGENVYNASEFKEEDVLDFLEMIEIKHFDKVRAFVDNLPHLYYQIKYKNKNDEEKDIELKTLSDFFTLY